jgi:hypothetical protein
MDEETVRKVLARAAAIQENELQNPDQLPLEKQPGVAELVEAATEAGLERSAVMHALRENAPVLPATVSVGGLVFAPSRDGENYVAKVLAIKDGQVEVRFFNGATARVYGESVEPFAPLPGQSVMCQRVDDWLEGQVLEYDPKKHYIRVKGEWGTSGLDLSQIRKFQASAAPVQQRNLFWLLVAVAFALGIAASEFFRR